jgi:O-methyltransferase
MNKKILEKRIQELDKEYSIGLYPDNMLAKKLQKKFGTKKNIKVLSKPCNGLDVVVITDDDDKVLHLKELETFFYNKEEPQIIMAGTEHFYENKIFVDKFIKDSGIDSKASGYELVQTHLYECLLAAKRSELKGHVIELGSYKGGTISLLYELSKNINIDSDLCFTGFDSWDGSRYKKAFLDLFDMPEWLGDNYSDVRDNLPKEIELVKGDISETFPLWVGNKTDPIVMAFIDTDNYSPVAKSLPLIWDRLAVGGAVVFDHYFTNESFFNTIGEHVAAKDFFCDKKNFFHLTGTGVFVKVAE